MENSLHNLENEGPNRGNSFQSLNSDMEVTCNTGLSKALVKRVNTDRLLIINVKQPQTRKSYNQNSHFAGNLGFNYRIPKRIVSVDEEYLRHCLDLIYTTAFNAASFRIPAKLTPSFKTGFSFDMAKFFIQSPSTTATRNAIISPAPEDYVGKITRSKSLMNIIKSPVFRQFGTMGDDVSNLIDYKGELCSDFVSGSGDLTIGAAHTLEKEPVVLETPSYGSSTSTAWSDQCSSSSSTSTISTQGMLQFTWKAGYPHFVFSVDEKKDIYVANPVTGESPDNKVRVYLYLFHSKAGGKKERDSRGNESDLVGKMTVRATPQNSEIMEAQFVLYGCIEEKQIAGHVSRKSTGLSRKVAEVFKTSPAFKQKSASKIVRTDEVPVYSCEDLEHNLIENLLPNFELAAIVVKDHVCNKTRDVEKGGWGLKFLKKVGIGQNVSENCPRNSGDCSTSIDIIVPGGFHGGPRTRSGGPSNLVERWRSGGQCDCGGWDIGCPLTVLKSTPTNKEGGYAFDLSIQGSKQDGATMKMVKMEDEEDSYIVHFEASLSALQCFSIAVALIHAHNPSLRSKLYRS